MIFFEPTSAGQTPRCHPPTLRPLSLSSLPPHHPSCAPRPLVPLVKVLEQFPGHGANHSQVNT